MFELLMEVLTKKEIA